MSDNTFVEIAEQAAGGFKLYRKDIENGAGEGLFLAEIGTLEDAIRRAQEEDAEYGWDVEWLTEEARVEEEQASVARLQAAQQAWWDQASPTQRVLARRLMESFWLGTPGPA